MNKTAIQGKYLSDVFLIEFPSHNKFFNKSGTNQGPKNQEDYATFVHEYWHFLLNISTVVRFRDFSTWHQFIPIFSSTLTENANGIAIGNNIPIEKKATLSELTDLYFSYNEDGYEEINGKQIKDFSITGKAIKETVDLTLKGKKVPFRKIKFPIEVKTEKGVEKTFYIVSNRSLDESIANSIEKIVFDDNSKPPVFPYLILEKLSEFYNNGIALSNYELAVLGTLSFLTTNPAESIEKLFIDYIDLRKSQTINSSVKEMCDRTKPLFMKVASVLLQDLQSIQDVYKNREPISQAMNYIANRIRKAIDMRLNNLLFDLEPFENGVLNQQKLNNLMFELIPPCDVRQEIEGDEDIINRDMLQSFDSKPINLNGNILYSSYLMQVLQCQMDYFKAHWALFNMMDSEKSNSKCPYYTTCDLPHRVNSPDICKTEPWKTFDKNHENCMYGSAVASLIGEVKIKPKNNA